MSEENVFEKRGKYVKKVDRRNYMREYTRENKERLNEQRNKRNDERRKSDSAMKEIKEVVDKYYGKP